MYPIKYKLYKGYNVNYLCTNIPDDPRCMNRVLTLDDMEREIAKHVKDNLDTCINIDAGYYNVQKGEKQVDVTIAENNVLIKLDYPLTLTKGSTVKQVKEFSNVVNVPLGKIYITVQEIVNSEALFADFDPLPYMLVHKDLLIERDKPYPDKVYNIKDENGYEFMFAVEGEEA